MEKNYWKPIRDFLDQAEVLHPIDTGVKKKFGKPGNIKAFIFDVYGTLLISASGDIDQADFSNKALGFAFNKAGIELNIREEERTDLLEGILQNFKTTVKNTHEQKKSQGIPFPEVDFVEVWKSVLREYNKEGIFSSYSEENLKLFTFLFELMSNKVYPMPHMKEIVNKLNDAGFPLGIISNAQFFTPVIMNYFLNGTLEEKTEISQFDNELVLYSYLLGRSKPDVDLFNEMKYILWNSYGIKAEETIYIGNDMYNDVYPAFRSGFQAALFAGDKRSLRWRENYEEVQDIQPHHIIADLRDLLNISGF